MNPFILKEDDYKRDVHPIKAYVEQAARYLSINSNTSYEQCKEFVKKNIMPNGLFPVHDPEITYFKRENGGDKVKTTGKLTDYIYSTIRNDEILAPTGTVYSNPLEEESLYTGFIEENMKLRDEFKGDMFEAIVERNILQGKLVNSNDTKEIEEDIKLAEEKIDISNNRQINAKVNNNSLSGAQVSLYNPISNITAHSSLTSTCRMTSSHANACNEKLITGNRHYFNYDIIINDIVSNLQLTDLNQLRTVIDKYNIHYPSVEEVMSMIHYSSNLYWTNNQSSNKIKEFILKLSPLERASFMYMGDFYHIRSYNNDLVRSMIAEVLSTDSSECIDAKKVMDSADDSMRNFVAQIYNSTMRGKTFNSIFKEVSPNQFDDNELAYSIANSINKINNFFSSYSDFIKIFFLNNILPLSVSRFPDSVRRSVLVSDTDSTIFTVMEWIKWYFKDLTFTDEQYGLYGFLIYISEQNIAHTLAIMSSNIGVEKKRIFQIKMKNEYRFDLMAPANRAKHYYAIMGAREGNIFTELETEVKGANFKSGDLPISMIQRAEQFMIEDILKPILNNEMLSAEKLLKIVADIERQIHSGILNADIDYMKFNNVKTADSYSDNELRSPYRYHTLWNEVFGPKYGKIGEPPYEGVRIQLYKRSPTSFKEWVDSIEDKELSLRFNKWLERHNMKVLNTIILPFSEVQANGIPQELLNNIDVRGVIKNIAAVFYYVLETLGIYILNDKVTKLAYDYY